MRFLPLYYAARGLCFHVQEATYSSRCAEYSDQDCPSPLYDALLLGEPGIVQVFLPLAIVVSRRCLSSFVVTTIANHIY